MRNRPASRLVFAAALTLCALALSPLVGAGAGPQPPVAQKHPVTHTIHDDTRVDDYAWLRGAEKPEVLAHLEAENAYTQAMMAHTTELQEQLYQEILARIKETDLSVPYRKGDFYYYSRTEAGKAYAIYCRKRGALDAPEEVILDPNELSKGESYYRVANIDVSPDHNLLAYAFDTTGGERYTLVVKDLRTGRLIGEPIEDTYYSTAWGNDNKTLFFTRPDHANRPYKLFRHTLGAPADQSELIHHEQDEAFFLSVGKTRSEAYIILSLGSMVTSEAWVLDAAAPTGAFRVVQPRMQDVEYDVEHHADRFLIHTNLDAENFRIVHVPVATPSREHWRDLIPHRDSVYITGVDAFEHHLVTSGREDGLPCLWVRDMRSNVEHKIAFPEPTYSVRPAQNPEFSTPTLRFMYNSFITPPSVYDYDMRLRTRTLLKQDEVPGYDPSLYEVKYTMAPARDGARVPVSIVHRKGIALDGSNPCLLYSYGSYGSSSSASFSVTNLPLLDRGFVYAVAHIRGGSEMGRRWYLDGKYLNKKNTFHDFIDAAEHLIDQGYTSAGRLSVMGGSAGGLLMGAVANMRPELFEVVVAHVPFVDVINTMLDETIPLTVIEWEQWGNPNDPVYYQYMKSYSPYDNVAAQDYPNILVTAGLHDPRVAYWEPAKWVAKLREHKTDHNALLLKTNMAAGHGGASGRYERYREIAFYLAFILDRLGVASGQLPQPAEMQD